MKKIQGEKVCLRPARPDDRRAIYEWLAESDLTHRMLGPPTFPDSPIPTWEEFQSDYAAYFFDSSQPYKGRCFVIEVDGVAVGQINHDVIHESDRTTELDIWMKNSRYTGLGYGSDAIITLCRFLRDQFDCRNFLISPSARNKAAIRAYEKAGFVRTNEKVHEALADYPDCIVLRKTLT